MLSGIFLYGENMKRLLIAGVVLLVSASALAEDCDNAISQTEMNMCSADQYDKADKKLNQTWQTALKRATPQQRDLLKKAQKNWIALRDADCAFIGSGSEQGSAQPMVINQCMTDKTNEREAWLSSPAVR
jgi:uncharacterized protein YecT (DUF1311 family)